jgi:translation initiation factor 1 (eIF-1/SUI1)
MYLKAICGPGAVIHNCNPTYLVDEDSKITVQGQSQQKVSEILFQRTNWAWWGTSVIPATWEA